MSLKALTIVKEEFEKIRNQIASDELDGFHADENLRVLEDRIAKRIEKECVEIPTCQVCGQPQGWCLSEGKDLGTCGNHDFTPSEETDHQAIDENMQRSMEGLRKHPMYKKGQVS